MWYRKKWSRVRRMGNGCASAWGWGLVSLNNILRAGLRVRRPLTRQGWANLSVTWGKGVSGRSACAKSPRRERTWYVPRGAKSTYRTYWSRHWVICSLKISENLLSFGCDFLVLNYLYILGHVSLYTLLNSVVRNFYICIEEIGLQSFSYLPGFHIKFIILLNELESVAYFTILWKNLQKIGTIFSLKVGKNHLALVFICGKILHWLL